MTSAERAALIEQLRRLPDEVAELVAGLTEEELVAHPLAGEWSVAQNVHHLVDSHTIGYVRCKLVLTEDQPALPRYDQNLWAELPEATSSEVGMSLTLLRALHVRWTAALDQVHEEDWQRVGIHHVNGEMTLDQLLTLYSGHGRAHIEQITRTKAAL